MIATAVDTALPASSRNSIKIVANRKSSLQVTVAKELYSYLGSHIGTDCQVLSVTDSMLGQVPAGSALVFIVEFDQPYIATLEESFFYIMQALLLGALRVVWITSVSTSAAVSIQLQMVKGLARVLRTEKPSRPFVTLNFDDKISSEDRINRMCQVISTTVIEDPHGCELEYVSRDGILMII